MQQCVLINSLLATDEVKYELDYIFETYYKRIYNYVFYRVNSHDIAEDLTSKVFENVMLKIETYCKDKAPFEVWLFLNWQRVCLMQILAWRVIKVLF